MTECSLRWSRLRVSDRSCKYHHWLASIYKAIWRSFLYILKIYRIAYNISRNSDMRVCPVRVNCCSLANISLVDENGMAAGSDCSFIWRLNMALSSTFVARLIERHTDKNNAEHRAVNENRLIATHKKNTTAEDWLLTELQSSAAVGLKAHLLQLLMARKRQLSYYVEFSRIESTCCIGYFSFFSSQTLFCSARPFSTYTHLFNTRSLLKRTHCLWLNLFLRDKVQTSQKQYTLLITSRNAALLCKTVIFRKSHKFKNTLLVFINEIVWKLVKESRFYAQLVFNILYMTTSWRRELLCMKLRHR